MSLRAETLLSDVPLEFRASLFTFDTEPWRCITYTYPERPAARVDASRLLGSMRAELNWWLWSLHVSGEHVNSWNLAAWVRLAEAVTAGAGLTSFVDWSADQWLATDRRGYHERHGRLPPKTYEQNH